MKTLYICGAGNSETIRLAIAINRQEARWDRIVLLDDDSARHGQSLLGVEIVGPFNLLGQVSSDSAEVTSAVARTTAKRWSAHRKLEEYGVPFANLVHPNVDLLGVELGKGVIVYQNATLGPQVYVGDGSVVFMGAAIGHESELGKCCVVAPNGVVNARVRLGDGVYVGTNATILPEVNVGARATIAAGSVAMKDVPPGATVIGVPGKIVFMLNQKPPRVPAPEPQMVGLGAKP
ncbi:MAG: hypothetical protein HY237_08205 [Acidobacteria bacterium]|nr:hypothetical protein [Acidobacteriota bacterium]